jgi:hypothetical protein
MSIKLTDEQQKEVVEILDEVNKIGLRLRHNVLFPHNLDYDSAGPLADACGLLRDARQSLRNYLIPDQASELDWQRKPEGSEVTGQPTIDSGTF